MEYCDYFAGSDYSLIARSWLLHFLTLIVALVSSVRTSHIPPTFSGYVSSSPIVMTNYISLTSGWVSLWIYVFLITDTIILPLLIIIISPVTVFWIVIHIVTGNWWRRTETTKIREWTKRLFFRVTLNYKRETRLSCLHWLAVFMGEETHPVTGWRRFNLWVIEMTNKLL